MAILKESIQNLNKISKLIESVTTSDKFGETLSFKVPTKMKKDKKRLAKYQSFDNRFLVKYQDFWQRCRVLELNVDLTNLKLISVNIYLVDTGESAKNIPVSQIYQIPKTEPNTDSHTLINTNVILIHLDEESTDLLEAGKEYLVSVITRSKDEFNWPEYKLEILITAEEMQNRRLSVPVKDQGSPGEKFREELVNKTVAILKEDLPIKNEETKILDLKPRVVEKQIKVEKKAEKEIKEEKKIEKQEKSEKCSNLTNSSIKRSLGRVRALGKTKIEPETPVEIPKDTQIYFNLPKIHQNENKDYKLMCNELKESTEYYLPKSFDPNGKEILTKILKIQNSDNFPQVTMLPKNNVEQAKKFKSAVDSFMKLNLQNLKIQPQLLKINQIYAYIEKSTQKLYRVLVILKSIDKKSCQAEIKNIDHEFLDTKTVDIDQLYHLSEELANIEIFNIVTEFDKIASLGKVLKTIKSEFYVTLTCFKDYVESKSSKLESTTELIELSKSHPKPYFVSKFVKYKTGLKGPSEKTNLSFYNLPKSTSKFSEWIPETAYLSYIEPLMISKTFGLFDALHDQQDKFKKVNLQIQTIIINKMYVIFVHDIWYRVQVSSYDETCSFCKVIYVDSIEKSEEVVSLKNLYLLPESLSIDKFPNDSIEVVHTPDLIPRFGSLLEALSNFEGKISLNLKTITENDKISILCDFYPKVENVLLNKFVHKFVENFDSKNEVVNNFVKIDNGGLFLGDKISFDKFNEKKEKFQKANRKVISEADRKFARLGEMVVVYDKNTDIFERAICTKESNEFYLIDLGKTLKENNFGIFKIPKEMKEWDIQVLPIDEKNSTGTFESGERKIKIKQIKKFEKINVPDLVLVEFISEPKVVKVTKVEDKKVLKDITATVAGNDIKLNGKTNKKGFKNIIITSIQCKFNKLGFYIQKTDDEPAIEQLTKLISENVPKESDLVPQNELEEQGYYLYYIEDYGEYNRCQYWGIDTNGKALISLVDWGTQQYLDEVKLYKLPEILSEAEPMAQAVYLKDADKMVRCDGVDPGLSEDPKILKYLTLIDELNNNGGLKAKFSKTEIMDEFYVQIECEELLKVVQETLK